MPELRWSRICAPWHHTGRPARTDLVPLASSSLLKSPNLVEQRANGSILGREMQLDLFGFLKNRPRILIGRRRPRVRRGGLDILADDDHR